MKAQESTEAALWSILWNKFFKSLTNSLKDIYEEVYFLANLQFKSVQLEIRSHEIS